MASERFVNALKRIPQAVPPIWFMRQAGRYHGHYQNLRSKHSFMELCKDPELAAEVAMGPIEDFDFDVSILFSDLLFPLEALGMGLTYEPAPTLSWQLTPSTIENLRPVAEALPFMEFQRQAVQATRERLPNSKSLIGFVGGPWTLFTYAAEGAHKGHLLTAKTHFDLFSQFCETIVPFLIGNIKMQIDGGAETIMIFDTAAGELSPSIFKNMVKPHLQRLAQEFPGRLGYYSKGTQPDYLSDMFSAGKWAGFGVDHRWSMSNLLRQSHDGFIQGNFDQALLFADKDDFMYLLNEYLAPLKELTPQQRAGWVCGLGHGVLPKTPVDNVKRFVEHVREVFTNE